MASTIERPPSANSVRDRLSSFSAFGPLDASPLALCERIFWLFLAGHVVFWTVIAVCTQPNRPLDMVEMLYWGRGWQWGYYKHPPLPAWIAEALFQATAGAAWPLYLAAQLAMATCFWAAWKLAKEFLPPWPALCASLLLETGVNYNVMTADFNNTIVLQPLWALAVWWLYRGLTTQRLGYWLATGVCLGLGELAKYDMGVLALSMLLLPVVSARARMSLKTPGPYLAIAVSLLIFAPHVAWMFQNDFPTVQYALTRAHNLRSWLGHVLNPLEFLLAQVLYHVPMLAITLPLWRKRGAFALSARDPFKRDFLLVVCLAPLAIDLSLSIITGIRLQSMWGAPIGTFSGVLLMAWISTAADWGACRTILLRTVAVGSILAIVFAGRNIALPYLRHLPSRVHFPGRQLAEVVQSQWQQHTDAPLLVVCGSWWTAANVGLHTAQHVEVYDFGDPKRSPWSGDEALKRRGGVIVWEDHRLNANYASIVRTRFPEARLLPPVPLAWQTSAPLEPARFHIAIVRPEGDSDADERRQAQRPCGSQGVLSAAPQ